MTQSIRDAAQALLDAYAENGPYRHLHISTARVALQDAMTFPQPTADERWVNMRAAVIDALAARNLQIFSNVHGVSLVPIRKSWPTADERVAVLMRAVMQYGSHCRSDGIELSNGGDAVTSAAQCARSLAVVQQSARALLSASQEDAEHAALRFMRLLGEDARTDVMSNFCKQCGSDNPSCQCWNDE